MKSFILVLLLVISNQSHAKVDCNVLLSSHSVGPRFEIYFRGPQSYLEDFLERAIYLLRLQDSIREELGESFNFPLESRSKILLKRYIRLFRNIFWLREYKILRDVGIDQDFHELLQAKNENAIREKLTKRFGPDISMEWYLGHIRNIQRAGTFALAAILIPQISGAYFHERTLENLENSKVETIKLKEAQEILSQSDMELKNIINDSLKSPQGRALTPAEMEFINELDENLGLPPR